jgi:hypothetical protein
MENRESSKLTDHRTRNMRVLKLLSKGEYPELTLHGKQVCKSTFTGLLLSLCENITRTMSSRTCHLHEITAHEQKNDMS